MNDTPADLRAKSTGGQPPSRFKISVVHQHHFTDYAGNPSIMVYRGACFEGDIPLPPLFSFQIYVTNGLGPYTTGDMPNRLLDRLQSASAELVRVRLDMYFLSGATVDQCRSHYRSEKAARAQAVLHVVPSYAEPGQPYSNIAIIVEEQEWDQFGVSVVRFDAPDEELSSLERDLEPPDKVRYDQYVPTDGPISLGDRIKNPRLEAVGALYAGIYRSSSLRERYDERYDEECEKGRRECIKCYDGSQPVRIPEQHRVLLGLLFIMFAFALRVPLWPADLIICPTR